MDIKNLSELNDKKKELDKLTNFIDSFAHYESKMSFKKIFVKPYGYYSGCELELDRITKAYVLNALLQSKENIEKRVEKLLKDGD